MTNRYKEKVTRQEYGNKLKDIPGVELHTRNLFVDDGGSFAELLRLQEGYGNLYSNGEPFQAKQCSYSLVLPGAVKAFHIHENQEDLWFVLPTDRLLVNLVDLREVEIGYNSHMRMVLGAGKVSLLRIPKGVAHGCANLSTTQAATLIYFTTEYFNLDAPDELRLPWNYFGKEMWEMNKG